MIATGKLSSLWLWSVVPMVGIKYLYECDDLVACSDKMCDQFE